MLHNIGKVGFLSFKSFSTSTPTRSNVNSALNFGDGNFCKRYVETLRNVDLVIGIGLFKMFSLWILHIFMAQIQSE